VRLSTAISPAESYDHRVHIYAAQDKGLHW
jgi:hypothetical protein